MPGSVRPLALMTILPSGPARPSVSISSTRPDRVVRGDTMSFRNVGGSPDPDSRLNSSPTSAPMDGSEVNRPRSS